MDPDAVVLEGDFRGFSIDEAAGVRLALEVIAVAGSGEELLVERAFKSAGGDLDFDGMGCSRSQERSEQKKAEAERYGRQSHASRIMSLSFDFWYLRARFYEKACCSRHSR